MMEQCKEQKLDKRFLRTGTNSWVMFIAVTIAVITYFPWKVVAQLPAYVPSTTIWAFEGSSANFSCQSHGVPISVCLWENDPPVESSNKRLLLNFNPGNAKPGEGPHPGYTYHGNGLDKGECGVVINSVQVMDENNWKCTLITSTGVYRGAVYLGIVSSPDLDASPAHVPSTIIGGVEGSSVNFSCQSYGTSINYCLWEQDLPAGSSHKPLILNFDSRNAKPGKGPKPGYNYLGDGLEKGECGLIISKVKQEHGATWRCTLITNSVTYRGKVKLGFVDKLYLNVTERSAYTSAVIVGTTLGQPANLSCAAEGVRVSLCLWEKKHPAADFSGLIISFDSINSTVNKESGYTNVWDGFEKGECGLIINNVQEKDSGSWKCSLITDVGVHEGIVEVGILSENVSTLQQPGFKKILVYKYSTVSRYDIGKVYFGDIGEWDHYENRFLWKHGAPSDKSFALDERNGMISLSSGTKPGRYRLEFNIQELVGEAFQRDFEPLHTAATVLVVVKELPGDTLKNHGSIRFAGITGEEFVRIWNEKVLKQIQNKNFMSLKC